MKPKKYSVIIIFSSFFLLLASIRFAYEIYGGNTLNFSNVLYILFQSLTGLVPLMLLPSFFTVSIENHEFYDKRAIIEKHKGKRIRIDEKFHIKEYQYKVKITQNGKYTINLYKWLYEKDDFSEFVRLLSDLTAKE